MDLVEYIKSLNEEARKWEEESPGRWASKFVEDRAHWNEMGIYTSEDFGDYLDACFQREVQKGNVYS